MLDFRMLGMGAAGGAVITALLIWPVAHGAGYGKAQSEAKEELAAAKRVAARLLAERDQARSEVDKVNQAIAAQVAELSRLMSADQAERQAAAQRMEAAAVEAAKEARLAGQRAAEARKVILNVADQCARGPVPPAVLDSLRDIAGPAS